jgi:hypothetical protein
MTTTDQMTAALWRAGIAVDPPTLATALQVERYKAAKHGGFLSEFTRGFSEGIGGGRFEEAKHPRVGKGKEEGGRFTSKGGGGGSALTSASPKSPAAPQIQGQTQTVDLDGTKWEVAQDGNNWYGKRAGSKTAEWEHLPPQTAAHVQDELARATFDQQQKQRAVAQRRMAGHSKYILDAIKAGPKNGHSLWKAMGIPKDDFLDAYFSLQEVGKIEQDRTGAISLVAKPIKPVKPRKATETPKTSPITGKPFTTLPAAPATQPTVIKAKRTPEQEQALKEAKEKTAKDFEQRMAAGSAESRKAAREDNTKRLTKTAEDFGIAPDDLMDSAKEIHAEKTRQHREREAIKADIRSSTGLTLNDIKRAENNSKDVSNFKVDKIAQVMGHTHPEIFGTDEGEYSAKLWDLLREGAKPAPSLYDTDLLNEAAQYVKTNREPGVDEGELVGVGSLEKVPFAKPGSPERYSLAHAFRVEFARRARIQRYSWNEQDHPRGQPENRGEFAPKEGSGKMEGIKTPAQELAESSHTSKISRTQAVKRAKAAGIHKEYLSALKALDYQPSAPTISPEQRATIEKAERERADKMRRENPDFAEWLTDGIDYDKDRSDDDILDEAANIRDEEAEAKQQAKDTEEREEEEYQKWLSRKEATEDAIEEASEVLKRDGWKVEMTGQSITGSSYFTLTKSSRFHGDDYGGVDVTLRISNHYAPKGSGFNQQTQEYHNEPDVNVVVTPGQSIDWPAVLKKANEAFDDTDREFS